MIQGVAWGFFGGAGDGAMTVHLLLLFAKSWVVYDLWTGSADKLEASISCCMIPLLSLQKCQRLCSMMRLLSSFPLVTLVDVVAFSHEVTWVSETETGDTD
jgi:hypothetical protein